MFQGQRLTTAGSRLKDIMSQHISVSQLFLMQETIE